MPSQPFASNLSHGLGYSIFHPGHEVLIKPEAGPARLDHESSYVLRVSIGVGYRCFISYPVLMPIKFHRGHLRMPDGREEVSGKSDAELSLQAQRPQGYACKDPASRF